MRRIGQSAQGSYRKRDTENVRGSGALDFNHRDPPGLRCAETIDGKNQGHATVYRH